MTHRLTRRSFAIGSVAAIAAPAFVRPARAGIGPVRIPTLLNGWEDYGASAWSTHGYFKDASGVVHLQGLLKGGKMGDNAIFQLPAGFRPSKRALFPVHSYDGNSYTLGRADVAADGSVFAFSGGNGYFCLDGITFRESGAIQTPELQGGWRNYEAKGWSTCGYFRDVYGVVHLQGLLAGGKIGDGAVIFKLPAAYRPRRHTLFPVNSYGSSYALGRADVTADGHVIALAGDNGYFSLDGISFNLTGSARATEPALQNGWRNYEATDWSRCAYFKDVYGVVHLQGLVTGGQIGGDAVIFQLPSGYRPSKRTLFPAQSYDSSGFHLGRADVAADGNVIAFRGGNGYFCLDGMSFSSDVVENDNVSLPYFESRDYLPLLDVWGEGRITTDGLITGFPQAYNLNKITPGTISSGPHRGQDIPNLVPVNDYDNPAFPLPANSVEHITLMGAPITTGTALEMYRVLDKGRGVVILYGPRDEDRARFEAAIRGKMIAKSDTLNAPFNEIDIPGKTYIYGFPNVINHDEL